MKDDISIVLSGEAGQGIRTVELLLIKSPKKSGYNVYSTSELMSRVRGGNNTTEIRVSNGLKTTHTIWMKNMTVPIRSLQ